MRPDSPQQVKLQQNNRRGRDCAGTAGCGRKAGRQTADVPAANTNTPKTSCPLRRASTITDSYSTGFYRARLEESTGDFFRGAHLKNGAPDGIRTHGPQIRNLVLYPAELRAPRPAHRAAPARWQLPQDHHHPPRCNHRCQARSKFNAKPGFSSPRRVARWETGSARPRRPPPAARGLPQALPGRGSARPPRRHNAWPGHFQRIFHPPSAKP